MSSPPVLRLIQRHSLKDQFVTDHLEGLPAALLPNVRGPVLIVTLRRALYFPFVFYHHQGAWKYWNQTTVESGKDAFAGPALAALGSGVVGAVTGETVELWLPLEGFEAYFMGRVFCLIPSEPDVLFEFEWPHTRSRRNATLGFLDGIVRAIVDGSMDEVLFDTPVSSFSFRVSLEGVSKFIEDKFGVVVTVPQLELVKTYGDLLRTIRSLVIAKFLADCDKLAFENSNAFVVLQLSAEEGSPDAQYCLAVICRSGSTCFHYRKDPTSEISLLKRAAATGHSLALDRLGALLESGSEVVNPNVVEAIRCYHESGSSFAQGRLKVLRAQPSLPPSARVTRERSDSYTRLPGVVPSIGRPAHPPSPPVESARFSVAVSLCSLAVVGVCAAYFYARHKQNE